MAIALEVQHLYRVVAQGGHEESLSGWIKSQVIDPPFHAREIHGGHQSETLLSWSLERDQREDDG